MTSLGSFGQVRPPVVNADPDTFEYFGSTIRIIDEVNEVELVDLMDAARNYDVSDMAALAIIKDGLQAIVDARDFDQFWLLARQNRQRIEDLAEVLSDLMSAVTNRPTQQPSDSSAGRLTTDASSPVASPSPASNGRPDLQLLREEGEASRARMAARLAG